MTSNMLGRIYRHLPSALAVVAGGCASAVHPIPPAVRSSPATPPAIHGADRPRVSVELVYPRLFAHGVGGNRDLVIAVGDAGDAGAVLEYRSGQMRYARIAGARELLDVHVERDGSAWAVGNGGGAWRSPRGDWTFVPCPGAPYLRAVHGDQGRAIGVGDRGAVVELSAGVCRVVRSCAGDVTLYSVFVAGDRVLVAGDRGLWERRQGTWRQIATLTLTFNEAYHASLGLGRAGVVRVAGATIVWADPDVGIDARWQFSRVALRPLAEAECDGVTCPDDLARTVPSEASGASGAWTPDGHDWWVVFRHRLVHLPGGPQELGMELALSAGSWNHIAAASGARIGGGPDPDTVWFETAGAWFRGSEWLKRNGFRISKIYAAGAFVIAVGSVPEAWDDEQSDWSNERLPAATRLADVSASAIRVLPEAAWATVGALAYDGRAAVCTTTGAVLDVESGHPVPGLRSARNERYAQLRWCCGFESGAWYGWSDGVVERRERERSLLLQTQPIEGRGSLGRAACDARGVRFSATDLVLYECSLSACRAREIATPFRRREMAAYGVFATSLLVFDHKGNAWLEKFGQWYEIRWPWPGEGRIVDAFDDPRTGLLILVEGGFVFLVR